MKPCLFHSVTFTNRQKIATETQHTLIFPSESFLDPCVWDPAEVGLELECTVDPKNGGREDVEAEEEGLDTVAASL